MIIKPRVRGFICVTAHPVGCEANVKELYVVLLDVRDDLRGSLEHRGFPFNWILDGLL